MRIGFLRRMLVAIAVFLLTGVPVTFLSADQISQWEQNDVLDMVVGDIQTVDVKSLVRVSMTKPDVADIADAQNNKVSLLAKKAGRTVLYLWDKDGKRAIDVRVVNEDLSTVHARLQKVLEEAGIAGLSLEENADVGRVVVTGNVSKDDKFRLQGILETYSDSILNLVKEEKNEDLIQVDMQIVEISTSMEKDLGIQWSPSASTTGATTGSSSASTSGLISESEKIPITNGNGNVGDFFKVGNLSRSPLQATVNAFIQEGKARLISKPRLVAVSGKQASFLVGGEIPILNTTTNTTGNTMTQSTTYSQYGVSVTVTPTIREGKIDMALNVDIRDIDKSNSTTSATAFITRTASTNLFMDNKQTIVLAGLIKYTDSEVVTRIPFLSKIPVLGALFTNRSTPSADTNTEMVIILTPVVLTDRKMADTQLIMPTVGARAAYKEIDAKYEHEVLPAWPAPKPVSVSSDDPLVDYVAVTAYARMVQAKISKIIAYSPRSQLLTGMVKLTLHILKNGNLQYEELTDSSGNNVLDKNALQAARSAAPFEPFTKTMDQDDIAFVVPIVYNRSSVQ